MPFLRTPCVSTAGSMDVRYLPPVRDCSSAASSCVRTLSPVVALPYRFRANKLSLNNDKTHFILFCFHGKLIPDNCNLIVSISDKTTLQVSSSKCLGIYQDQNFT